MTDKEKRIFIAEACGWKLATKFHVTQRVSPVWRGPDGKCAPLPDFLNSRDAIHTAIDTIRGDTDKLNAFIGRLWDVMEEDEPEPGGGHFLIGATARQLSEAFIRTIRP